MNPKPEYIYIAFDVFPSHKGAATHINHCLKALDNTFKAGLLICLGHDDLPAFQFDAERNLYVYRWKEKVINFLERTYKFQLAVSKLLNRSLCSEVKLVHFRDIWGGIPILKNKSHYKTVFEVNAFSHIELPNRYPNVSESVLDKIKNYECFCITHSDRIITPSQVTQNYIIKHFAIEMQKINVIPNGVTLQKTKPKLEKNKDHSPYILYFGALQKWQGIKTLFKAFKELEDRSVRLLICASVPEKRTLVYHELAFSIGISSKIDWFYELDKPELSDKIAHALISVAPLSACSRNTVQGCNPLKILESMAYGTPVIASDIPVVRELIADEDTGFLVMPDRPERLGRKIRALLEKPEVLKRVGENGKNKIEKNYLWDYQEAKMKDLYKKLLCND